MKVLFIATDCARLECATAPLDSAGWVLEFARNSADGIALACEYVFDVVVVDETLDVPPLRFMQLIRSRSPVPIIVLRNDPDPRKHARILDAGADDCMQKPYHLSELLARICAVSRRARRSSENMMRIGDLALDPESRNFLVRGVPVYLAGKQFQTIECLMVHMGRVVTKEMLLDYLYRSTDAPCVKSVDVLICKVRKVLSRMHLPGAIETVRGTGYMIPSPASVTTASEEPVAEAWVA